MHAHKWVINAHVHTDTQTLARVFQEKRLTLKRAVTSFHKINLGSKKKWDEPQLMHGNICGHCHTSSGIDVHSFFIF